MATKKQKKLKKQIIKRNQTLIKNKNIESVDLHMSQISDSEDATKLDFDNISELDGVKAFTLITVSKMISDLNSGDFNDDKIFSVAQDLVKLAVNPKQFYMSYLKSVKSNITKEEFIMAKKLSAKSELSLNLTERALVKSQAEGICMDFYIQEKGQPLDYGAFKVSYQLIYNSIFIGLENKKISRIHVYVGYGDVLSDFKVEYRDTESYLTYIDNYAETSTEFNDFKVVNINTCEEKELEYTYTNNSLVYDLNSNIGIFVTWHPLDYLYNQLAIYKQQYYAFDESSLNSLATAYELEQYYDKRTEGHELLNYNSLALNYLSVFEIELKKLISVCNDMDTTKLRLVDAINHLKTRNLELLSEPTLVDELHEMRKLRNNVAHGHNILKEEFKYVKDILINGDVFKYISMYLNKL